jgi:hypothetical protein
LLLASAPPPASAPPAEASAAPPDEPAPSSSSLAVAASASARPVAGPPCGSLASGLGVNLPEEKVKELALAYYGRTLRPRVIAWARETWGKSEPGESKLIRTMALQMRRVSSAEPVAENEAQKELDALSSNGALRLVCRAATVGPRPLWRVNFFTELSSPPHRTDIGMVLEMFVDATSGEVVLVVYGPLLV